MEGVFTLWRERGKKIINSQPGTQQTTKTQNRISQKSLKSNSKEIRLYEWISIQGAPSTLNLPVEPLRLVTALPGCPESLQRERTSPPHNEQACPRSESVSRGAGTHTKPFWLQIWDNFYDTLFKIKSRGKVKSGIEDRGPRRTPRISRPRPS